MADYTLEEQGIIQRTVEDLSRPTWVDDPSMQYAQDGYYRLQCTPYSIARTGLNEWTVYQDRPGSVYQSSMHPVQRTKEDAMFFAETLAGLPVMEQMNRG